MQTRMRHVATSLALVAVAMLGACGDSTPTDSNGGNGGSIDSLQVFDVVMRPQAIQRASSLAGSSENPVGAVYYLTAFFAGGAREAKFEWQVPDSLGTIKPSSDQLSLTAPAVVLLNHGHTPLGFYDIAVTGTSAGMSRTVRRRFAATEANWMKHRRTNVTDPEKPPENLISYPTFSPEGDEIYYIAWPNDLAVDIFSIRANTRLDGPQQLPRERVFQPPPGVDFAQASEAQELAPDFSPPALERNEVLFSSQMDLEHDNRGTGQVAPFNLWVVRRADLTEARARPLTFDSTEVVFPGPPPILRHYAFDYLMPRWDPSPTEPVQDARIAFLADLDDGFGLNIWVAELRDNQTSTVARSDTLVGYERVTDGGSITSFDWHPQGEYIYYTNVGDKGAVIKLHLGTQTDEIIRFAQDPAIETVNSISVYFDDTDGTTLLAFEGVSENQVHLFVYNENDGELTRLNRFAFPLSLRLFPRWHRDRREIVFVSDYSVAAWASGVDPLPEGDPNFGGHRRTAAPSVWTIRLESP